MPVRATKRGTARTPLHGDVDVLICGASFAGLAVARELRGSGARVLVLDRYDIGERATSACGIPTVWLSALGLQRAQRQSFSELVVHTPDASVRFGLPWSFSTFDYHGLCADLFAQCDAAFEHATVRRREQDVVVTDRGGLRAPLIVDALGWRRTLGTGENVQPPEAFLSRGLEVHPGGSGPDMEIWIDRGYVRAGYGWSFPAAGELRIGVGSFAPRDHVREPTARLAADLDAEAIRYQGNWIPHKLRPPVEDGIAFVGDSAGHCLPLTAEGIRPALYFGIALGRELRAVVEGRSTKAAAHARYGGFHAAHLWHFTWMLRVQNLIPRLPPSGLAGGLRAMRARTVSDWAFEHYLEICHPRIVGEARSPTTARLAAA
ncbi:MAG: NAD(P)/FAD-dependent oxidoreductase [Solirubrobacteraceae bacterium]|nr:MAG: monooxygenase [Solirubrobacterales bacterium]